MIKKLAIINYCKILRWIPPIIITSLFVVLLGHKSKYPLLFSRYSIRHLFLSIGMGILTWSTWKIFFNKEQYSCLSSRILKALSSTFLLD